MLCSEAHTVAATRTTFPRISSECAQIKDIKLKEALKNETNILSKKKGFYYDFLWFHKIFIMHT